MTNRAAALFALLIPDTSSDTGAPLDNDADRGGMCFEEDGEMEDWDLEDGENGDDLDPIPEITATSSQADWLRTLNLIGSRLNDGHGMTSDALADLRDGIRSLQEKIAGRRPEEHSTDERAMVGRYIRANGRGEMVPCLVRSEIKIGSRTIEVAGFLDDVSDNLPEIQVEIQRLYEQRYLIRMIKGSNGRTLSRNTTAATDAEIKRLTALLPDALQRAFVDVAGSGAEFIPTATLPTIVRAAEWQRRLAAYFEVISLNSADAKLPRMDSGAIPYLISERTTDDPSKIPSSSPVTADNTLTPVTMAARVRLSANASEDAIITMMPLIRANLVEALVAGEEDAILNGDTGTHQDAIEAWNPNGYYGTSFLATAGGAADHRRGFIGLRARAADVSNTVDRSTLTFANQLTDQANMVGQPGPNGSIEVASPGAIGKIGALEQFATIDKVGPAMATALRGLALGSVAGMPLVPSEFMTDDLESTGLYTDGSGAVGSSLMVRTGRFRIFDRRTMQIEQAKEISTQMIELVVTRRFLFAPIGSTAEKNVRYLKNVG